MNSVTDTSGNLRFRKLSVETSPRAVQHAHWLPQTENNEASLNRPRASGCSWHLNPAASRRARPHRQGKPPRKNGRSPRENRQDRSGQGRSKKSTQKGGGSEDSQRASQTTHWIGHKLKTGLEGWHGSQTGKARGSPQPTGRTRDRRPQTQNRAPKSSTQRGESTKSRTSASREQRKRTCDHEISLQPGPIRRRPAQT